jgi:hypothetical protein
MMNKREIKICISSSSKTKGVNTDVEISYYAPDGRYPGSVADPDPLVRGMDPDPDPSIIKKK